VKSLKPKAASGRKVPCPRCRALAVYSAANPWRPFCSERCRNGDLGAWASESYRVAVQPKPEDLLEENFEETFEEAFDARPAKPPLPQ